MSRRVQAARAVRRHGPAGIARIAADRTKAHVRLDEEHVWYGLELPSATGRPFGATGDGLRLVEPRTAQELAPFDGLPTLDFTRAWARVQQD